MYFLLPFSRSPSSLLICTTPLFASLLFSIGLSCYIYFLIIEFKVGGFIGLHALFFLPRVKAWKKKKDKRERKEERIAHGMKSESERDRFKRNIRIVCEMRGVSWGQRSRARMLFGGRFDY